MLFLINYDRSAGRVVELKAFDDDQVQQATEVRLQLELEENRRGLNREVVLFDAPSEAVLRKTHSRYFCDIGELIDAMGK